MLGLTEAATTLFRWNVYFSSGFSRSIELGSGPFALSSLLGATNTSFRGSPYTTVANFMTQSRFTIGYGNNSGTANESGLVSAILLVKRIS